MGLGSRNPGAATQKVKLKVFTAEDGNTWQEGGFLSHSMTHEIMNCRSSSGDCIENRSTVPSMESQEYWP